MLRVPQAGVARRRHNIRIDTCTGIDGPAAEEYGYIRAELKAKGRPIPSTDAQITAVARIHGLTVLSADRHFDCVDHLTAQNWL